VNFVHQAVVTCGLLLIAALANAQDVSYAQPPSRTPLEQLALVVGRDLRLDPVLVSHKLEPLVRVEQVQFDLRVESVKREFRNTWLLRLGCTAPPHCMSFAAVLHDVELDSSSWREMPLGPPTIEGAERQQKKHGPVVVHKGAKVDVVHQFGNVKLVLKAVSLEAGGVGDRVRVRHASSHHVLTATVVGPGTLWVGEER